jgi:beta-glucanase (GH16 family)
MTTKNLFQDDFSTNGPIDVADYAQQTTWHFNLWQQDNNPSYLWGTNFRQSVPVAQGGVVQLPLDTWNPATLDGHPPSFLGSEAFTVEQFSLPGDGGGIAFEAVAKLDGSKQGGLIAGLFSYEYFLEGTNRSTHDEIDFEIITSNVSKNELRVSTNVFKQETGDPQAHPISLPQYPNTLPASFSFSDWHTYRMEWFPDHVSWYLDGALIRKEETFVPTKPQQFHMNLWATPSDWGPSAGDPPYYLTPGDHSNDPHGPRIGDPTLTPSASADDNPRTLYFYVDSVKVDQISEPTAGNQAAGPPTTHGDLVVFNDAYVTMAGHALSIASPASVLANDSSSSTMHSMLITGPSHGTLNLANDGTFNYTPNGDFSGTDSFVYQATDDTGAIGSATAFIHVAPTKVGATTTLDFANLSYSEQVAALYNGFLGRGADFSGFLYWLGQQFAGSAQKGALASITDIANSFAASGEAKAIFALLANPAGATDAQVTSFLDGIYHNLFGRSIDTGGQAYWMGQIKQAVAGGQSVGAIVVNIINGAQDTASNHDITALLNKVQVNLEYLNQQFSLHTDWSAADQDAAAALVGAVTADPLSALTGIKQAGNLILSAYLSG